MYWAISSILISLAGLLTMIFYRRWEIKVGRINLGGKRIEGMSLPAFVSREIRTVFDNFKKESGQFLSEIAIPKTVSLIAFVREKVESHPRVKDISSMVRGTVAPKANGEASEYLRSITEHKEARKNGEEEVK